MTIASADESWPPRLQIDPAVLRAIARMSAQTTKLKIDEGVYAQLRTATRAQQWVDLSASMDPIREALKPLAEAMARVVEEAAETVATSSEVAKPPGLTTEVVVSEPSVTTESAPSLEPGPFLTWPVIYAGLYAFVDQQLGDQS